MYLWQQDLEWKQPRLNCSCTSPYCRNQSGRNWQKQIATAAKIALNDTESHTPPAAGPENRQQHQLLPLATIQTTTIHYATWSPSVS